MKKAVILSGGKQYLVAEGDSLSVEMLKTSDKTVKFTPLLVIDGDKTVVGTPEVKDASVTAEIETIDKQDDKVTSIRYKAKKRVHTVRGHRQHKTHLRIKKIA